MHLDREHGALGAVMLWRAQPTSQGLLAGLGDAWSGSVGIDTSRRVPQMGGSVVMVPLPVEIGVYPAGPLVTVQPRVEFSLLAPSIVQGGQSAFETLQHIWGLLVPLIPMAFHSMGGIALRK